MPESQIDLAANMAAPVESGEISPAQEAQGEAQALEAVVTNIIQEMGSLPYEVQTELLGMLNQQFQAVQNEQANSPQAAEMKAAEMANLIA